MIETNSADGLGKTRMASVSDVPVSMQAHATGRSRKVTIVDSEDRSLNGKDRLLCPNIEHAP